MLFSWGNRPMFQWDKHNIGRGLRNGILDGECERVIKNPETRFWRDQRSHGYQSIDREERYVAIAALSCGNMKKYLYVVFTMREGMIRIITGRIANRRERNDLRPKFFTPVPRNSILYRDSDVLD